MSIDVETAEFNRRLEEILNGYPRLTELTPIEARRQREEGRSAFGPIVLSAAAVEGSIPGPAGPIKTRMFIPDHPKGIYLHLHGGGWVLGGIHHQDARLAQLSEECGVVVISIGYRLAPEHPYPEGPDDCEAAALWLVENALSKFGTERLIIGGESAGAHLSVVTLLRLKDRHGLRPFSGANLVYGAYDLSLTASARAWGDRLLVLNTPYLIWFIDHFVSPDLRSAPDVSPLYADLAGLPAALFTIGTEDPLIDDTLLMHDRWAAAENRAELAVYPGGSHGFDAFPIMLAGRALSKMHEFIGRFL